MYAPLRRPDRKLASVGEACGVEDSRLSEQGPKRNLMLNQTLVITIGLGLAAWGHLLLHDLFGTTAAWARVDELFPAAVRSSPLVAGRVLLIMGALLVLAPVLG